MQHVNKSVLCRSRSMSGGESSGGLAGDSGSLAAPFVPLADMLFAPFRVRANPAHVSRDAPSLRLDEHERPRHARYGNGPSERCGDASRVSRAHGELGGVVTVATEKGVENPMPNVARGSRTAKKCGTNQEPIQKQLFLL
jgi:hypothetical protein